METPVEFIGVMGCAHKAGGKVPYIPGGACHIRKLCNQIDAMSVGLDSYRIDRIKEDGAHFLRRTHASRKITLNEFLMKRISPIDQIALEISKKPWSGRQLLLFPWEIWSR